MVYVEGIRRRRRNPIEWNERTNNNNNRGNKTERGREEQPAS